MKFLRNHWYDAGLIPMTAAVIFWHQFEEYRFPGGEAAITNLASQPSEDGPADRYPLNQNNAMVMNVGAAYTAYLFPVLFPNVLWSSGCFTCSCLSAFSC